MVKYEKAIQHLMNNESKYDDLKAQVNDQIQKKINLLEQQVKDIKSTPKIDLTQLEGSPEDQHTQVVNTLTDCLEKLRGSQSQLTDKIECFYDIEVELRGDIEKQLKKTERLNNNLKKLQHITKNVLLQKTSELE